MSDANWLYIKIAIVSLGSMGCFFLAAYLSGA